TGLLHHGIINGLSAGPTEGRRQPCDLLCRWFCLVDRLRDDRQNVRCVRADLFKKNLGRRDEIPAVPKVSAADIFFGDLGRWLLLELPDTGQALAVRSNVSVGRRWMARPDAESDDGLLFERGDGGFTNSGSEGFVISDVMV